MNDTVTDPEPSSRSGRNVGHDARLVLATVLLVVLAIFGVNNRASTRIDWIVGHAQVPLALLLAIAALAGALVGWLYLHRPRRHADQ